jgi:cyanophycinase-like exopeptidase
VTTPGRVYLIGSGHGPTVSQVARRVEKDLGSRRFKVAVSFAAMPHVKGDGHTRSFAQGVFPEADVERFSVEGEQGAMKPDEARAVVERADVVFIGGGDPVLGAERLVRAGADTWVQAARARGAACMGLSAGSIELGAFWGSWPDDAPHGDPALVRCLSAVPSLVVDCHAEQDDWEELHAVQRSLGPEGAPLTFAGIGHGSALIIGSNGELTWLGKPFVLPPLTSG